MNTKSPLFKFQAGLIVVGVFVLTMLVCVILLASGARQDIKTQKAASKAADKLNSYITSKGAIPGSLNAAGIRDMPRTISYHKVSDSSYKFCVTYKSASKNLSGDALVNAAISGYSGASSYDSYTSTESLYIPSTHKKGENCQTIKPYLYSSSYNSSSDTTNPYKICETAYDYWWSFLKVTSVTLPSGNTHATLYTDDSTNRSVELDSKVKVFDHSCNAITLNDLHAGDYVDVYFHPFGSPATAIVKEY